MKINNFLYVFYYFLIFAFVALIFHPIPTGIKGLAPSWNATLLQIHQYWGGSDPGSFSLGGLTIFKKGWLDADTIWLLSFWPPGFMWFEAVIMKVFGFNAPIIIILQLFAALLLGYSCNLFRKCIELFLKNKFISFTLPLTLLLFPEFRVFMLDRSTVVLGETFSIGFVLLGLFYLILAYAQNKKSFAIMAGAAFALSAYIRPQYETFFVFASINFLFLFCLLQLYKKIRINFDFSNPSDNNSNLKKISPIMLIFTALVMFHFLTIPYRIYNYMRIGSVAWVQDAPFMWQLQLTHTQILEHAGGGFEALGGGNTACTINEKLCNQFSLKIANGSVTEKDLKKAVLVTLYKHPFGWMSLKFGVLPMYWFGSLNNWQDLIIPTPSGALMRAGDFITYAAPHADVENLIFLGCFIFSLIWLVLTWRDPYSLILFWLSSSFFIAYFVIFLFVHYEARYFFFFKFYFLVVAMLSMAQLINRCVLYKSKSSKVSLLPAGV